MNERRIVIGLAAWVLGIAVPVCQHVALHAAVATRPMSNDVTRIRWVWDSIPWQVWVYVALMFAVGGVLVASGLLAGRAGRSGQAPPQRGFDVIDLPTSPHGR